MHDGEILRAHPPPRALSLSYRSTALLKIFRTPDEVREAKRRNLLKSPARPDPLFSIAQPPLLGPLHFQLVPLVWRSSPVPPPPFPFSLSLPAWKSIS